MNNELANLIQSLENSSRQVQESFGKLSESQLNWKPAVDKWSVDECIDHLIKANTLYFPQFEKIIKGEHKNSFWQTISPLSGMWGSFLLKSVSPDNAKNIKTASVFQPFKSSKPLSIISDFVKNNDELSGYIKKLEATNLKKTKISSPVSGFITYSLENTLNILTSHEQRHINQAKRVTNMEGFPKS